MYYSTFKISVELATTPGWRTTVWGLLNYVPKGPDLVINKRDLEKFVIMHAFLTERIIRCSYEMTVFVHGSRGKPLKYQNHCFKTVGRERFSYANLLVYFNSPGSHFSSTCWPLIILCSKVNVQWRLWKFYFYRSRIHFFVDPFVSLFNLQRSLPKKSVKTVFARIIL